MGDARYERHLDRILAHGPASLSELEDDEVIQALGALAARNAPASAYLSNVLTSEVLNRLARAHTAVMHSASGIIALDTDGAAIFANPAAERTLAWTQRELRGIHVHTLVHRERTETDCPLSDLLTSSAERHRSMFTRKDGKQVAVEYSLAPVLRDDEVQGAVLEFHEHGTFDPSPQVEAG